MVMKKRNQALSSFISSAIQQPYKNVSFILVRFTVYQQRIMVSAGALSNVFPMYCNDFNPKG